MSFYKYCPKCGNIISIDNISNCNFCNELYITTNYKWSFDDISNDPKKREIILEEYVKPNPLFDEELYNKRIALEKAQQQATLDMMRMKNNKLKELMFLSALPVAQLT